MWPTWEKMYFGRGFHAFQACHEALRFRDIKKHEQIYEHIYTSTYYHIRHSLDLREIRLGQEPFLWADLLSWHEVRKANHSSTADAATALSAITGASRLSVRPGAKRLDASVVLSREKIGEHRRSGPGDSYEVLWESGPRERKRSIDRWRVTSRDGFITARQHTDTLTLSTA